MFNFLVGVQVNDHLSRSVKLVTGKKDVSLHTFRHTHISHAMNVWGRNATVVQRWVGHKDLQTTQQYVHVASWRWLWAISSMDVPKRSLNEVTWCSMPRLLQALEAMERASSR